MAVVLVDHCYGLSADDPQSRLLSHTRASDGGFQSAVVGLVTFSGSDRERCLVRWTEPRVTCTCRFGRKLYQYLPAFGI